MSRLDSVIRRLEAQRRCIGWARDQLADLPGVVLELGLGNGRTYDHLRETFPGREIYVFEREVQAHPDCRPDDAHLFLGDVRETLPRALARLGRDVALAHSDVGTGDEARNRALAAQIAPGIARMMRRGGLVLSDQTLEAPGLERRPAPEGVPADRYFVYRAVATDER